MLGGLMCRRGRAILYGVFVRSVRCMRHVRIEGGCARLSVVLDVVLDVKLLLLAHRVKQLTCQLSYTFHSRRPLIVMGKPCYRLTARSGCLMSIWASKQYGSGGNNDAGPSRSPTYIVCNKVSFPALRQDLQHWHGAVG